MDSLIKIEGKPIEKLIDVVSNAVGGLLKPWQTVRVAKAQAKSDSIIAIEQAKTNAIIEGDIEKVQYLEAINERLVNKEKRRQKNIENVVTVAGTILQTEEKVSEESVNQDWATRFFDIVQDVSDDEMQLLWGRILAGEIKQPKSYSLRTLETLRNMTKEEAEIFQKVAQFILVDQDIAFLFTSFNDLKNFGIPYCYIAKLIEIGLIQSGDNVRQQFNANNTSEINKTSIIYGNIVMKIDQMPGADLFSFPVRLLTTPGKELARLIPISPNLDYVKKMASTIKRDDVKVSCSIISSNENGNVDYDELIEL